MKTIRTLTIILVLGLLAVAGRGVAQASGSQYTTLDGPRGASSTSVYGINQQGDIVGPYTDSKGLNHGFLLHRGHYSTLDAPHAGTGAAEGTSASGINQQGDVVGTYTDRNTANPKFPPT